VTRQLDDCESMCLSQEVVWTSWPLRAMPHLVYFGRLWRLSSDELSIPSICAAVFDFVHSSLTSPFFSSVWKNHLDYSFNNNICNYRLLSWELLKWLGYYALLVDLNYHLLGINFMWDFHRQSFCAGHQFLFAFIPHNYFFRREQ
jgi:hypothetical protein